MYDESFLGKSALHKLYMSWNIMHKYYFLQQMFMAMCVHLFIFVIRNSDLMRLSQKVKWKTYMYERKGSYENQRHAGFFSLHHSVEWKRNERN